MNSAVLGEVLLTLCYLVSIAGSALIARHHLLVGLGLNLLGNLLAVAAGCALDVYSMIVFSGLWAGTNLWAIWSNRPKASYRSEEEWFLR